MHTTLRLSLALTLLVFAACNETYRPSPGCSSDDECLLGRVCSPEGQCVGEAGPVLDAGSTDAENDAGADVEGSGDVTPDAPPPIGVLVIEPALADFGDVLAGEERSLALRVENVGAAAVAVDAVALEGEGFRLDDTLPETIAPGQRALLSVVTKQDEPGELAAAVVVTYDGSREARASVRARFLPENPTACLLFSPGATPLGQVLVGEVVSTETQLINCGTAPAAYEVLAPDLPEGVVLEVDDADDTLDLGEAVTVRLRADTGGLPARGFFFLVRAEGEGGAQAVWTVSGDLVGEVVPECVESRFGEVLELPRASELDGGVARADALFRNCGEEPLTVVSLSPSGSPQFSFAVPGGTIAPGEDFAVSVGLDRSAAGAFGGAFTLETRAGGIFGPFLVSGEVVPEEGERCVEASPTAVDFGEVSVGETAVAPLRLSNCGSVALTPAALGFLGFGPFLATWTSLDAIAPGASRDVTLSFVPARAGLFTDTLLVGLSPELRAEVALLGVGAVEAPDGVLTFRPAALNFGEVRNGQRATLVAEACNETESEIADDVLEIIEADIGLPLAFSFEVGGSAPAPGECVDVSVTFAPRGVALDSAASFEGTLVATTAGGTTTLALSGFGVGDPVSTGRCLESSGSQDVLASVGVERLVEVSFTNCGDEDLQILEPFTDLDAPFPAAFNVVDLRGIGDDGVLGPGSVATVTVRFGATRPGEYRGLVILSAVGVDDAFAELFIEVVDDAPEECVEITPTSLNFGSPGVGVVVAREVTIENCGLEPLLVEPAFVAFGTQGFSVIEDARGLLDPGASRVVRVRFIGPRLGVFADTLVVEVEGVRTERITMRAEVDEVSFCPSLDAGAARIEDGPFVEDFSMAGGDEAYLDSGYPFPDAPGVSFDWALVSFDGIRPPELSATTTPGRVRLSDVQIGTYTYRVTYTSPDGCAGEDTVTFEKVSDTGVGEGLRFVISWRSPGDDDELVDPGTDVDLHVSRRVDGRTRWNGAEDCYYGNPETDWGVRFEDADNGRLLRDEVNGLGPEIIVIEEPALDEVYFVLAHYFSDSGFGASDVTLRVFRDGVQVTSLTETLRETGETWLAVEVRNGGATIQPVDQLFPAFPPEDAP